SFFMYGLTSRVPFLNRLETIIIEIFRNENRPPNFSTLFMLISALAALVFGILFATFFADRTQFPKYILAGMLGWLAPSAIVSVFSNTIYSDHYFDSMQIFYLYTSEEILSGAFLGLIFSVAKSKWSESFRMLAVVTFIFPVITYFYTKALYYFDVVTTPWFLTALIVMVFIYVIVVFVIGWLGERKMPWVVFVGAIAAPLVIYIPILVLPKVFVSLTPELNVINNITSLPILGTVVFKIALQQAMLGSLLGLILGILLGFMKRQAPPQLTA
ncbi:MAG: hypothetical protein Q8K92_17895, partial [Leadbetterella sp.]|nr:hypothetical protein [Leadbetterella sp.]